MNRKLVIGIGGAAAVCAVGIGLLAWWRVHESSQFTRDYTVKAPGGANYVVRVNEVTAGKTGTGYVILVSLSLRNPNAFDVTLDRKNFILVDHAKEYFWPANLEPLRLPAHGSVEREILSFAVLDTSLAGVLAVQVGPQFFVMLKNEQPFTRRLNNGEFVAFRRRNW